MAPKLFLPSPRAGDASCGLCGPRKQIRTCELGLSSGPPLEKTKSGSYFSLSLFVYANDENAR